MQEQDQSLLVSLAGIVETVEPTATLSKLPTTQLASALIANRRADDEARWKGQKPSLLEETNCGGTH